jgi:hypothetical protein
VYIYDVITDHNMKTLPPQMLAQVITPEGLSLMHRIFDSSLSPMEMIDRLLMLKSSKQYAKLVIFCKYYLEAGYPIGNLLDHLPAELVLDIRDFKC